MTRFGNAVQRTDERRPGVDLPLLSVSQTRGVLRQIELTGRPHRAESLDPYKICREGDIVFNKMSIRTEAMGVAGEDGLVTYHYEVMRPRQNVSSDFINYVMKSDYFRGELVRRERGIGAGGHAGVRTTEVPFSSLRLIDIYLPSLEQQDRISQFLDRETAKIDALIAKQEQLITTLDERWNALTSLLISGISARGIQRRVSAVAQFINGFPFDSESFDMFGEVPLVRIRDILSDKFETFVPRSSVPQKAWIRDGDLVIGMDGDFNLTLWDRGAAALNQRVCVLRTAEPVVGSWIAYCLPAELKKINDLTYATTVKHLSSNQIARIMIPMPDLPEMTKAVQELDRENARVGRLLGRIRESLTLLRERRQALISAAVTGKLEVGV